MTVSGDIQTAYSILTLICGPGRRIRVARLSMINYGLKAGCRAVVDLDRQVFGTYD